MHKKAICISIKAVQYSLYMAIILCLLGMQFAQAKGTIVPAGNRNAAQPPIAYGAIKRTQATNSTFEKKYQKIYALLKRDKKLMGKIKKAASTYGIHPIHIIGALVGEHTYNVDAIDRLQTYYVKAASYLGQDLSFKYKGEKVSKFVKRPEFAKCKQYKSNYDLWECREAIWNSKFRGKVVGGKAYPNNRFGRIFFQPLYAGQTFGLGQLNPLTALKVTDIVSRKSGYSKLTEKRASEVYKTIMHPDSTLHYMAAIIRHSIDVYNQTAGFDISQNPGITATLYNLGHVRHRARQLKAKNQASGTSVYPQENYYGWLINHKLDHLMQLL